MICKIYRPFNFTPKNNIYSLVLSVHYTKVGFLSPLRKVTYLKLPSHPLNYFNKKAPEGTLDKQVPSNMYLGVTQSCRAPFT